MNLNLLPLALSALCLLSACQAAPSSESAQPSASDATVTVSAAAQTDTTLFSERDLAGTYDADSAIAIQLTGGSASCDSSAVAIDGGTFTVTSGKDALHAENTDDATLGSLYIADGAFPLDAQGDGISASGTLQIDGGTFSVVTGGGSSTVTLTSSESFGAGRPGETQTQTSSASTEETDTASTKGLKADGSLTLNGGTFTLDTADDSLHAGGDILIASGEFNLSSGDDAIHSDAAVTIRGGTFTIPYCYEGIEGLSITIDDGTFDITSYDDGVNAAGGADGSGFGPRQDTFSSTSSSTSSITINGGTFTIVSTGDCLDSNGDLTINGGTLDLTCNGSGNTTLDTDGTFTNNGGDLTTNDGSESNPGGMAGGHGGGMMGGGGRGGQAAPSGMPNAGSGSAEIPSA